MASQSAETTPNASIIAPPAKSPMRLSGGNGRLGAADGVQHAGQRNVVDVVAGGVGERPRLAPAGDAAEHQLRIAGEADIGAEAEPLHHARAKAFDDGVGAGDEFERERRAFGVLEVEAYRAAAAVDEVRRLDALERILARRGLAVDPQHVGAHVGEHHAGERRGADARHLDDVQSCKRPHSPPLRRSRTGYFTPGKRCAISLRRCGELDVGVGDLMADVVGAERERDDVVGIVEFGMMVHHLGLDADQHDIGDGVAEGLEGEGLRDVLALAPPARGALSEVSISASVRILWSAMRRAPLSYR